MMDPRNMTRPGSEMETIANRRQEGFDNQFFNTLLQHADSNQLSHDFYGNVSYDGTSSFPTLEEAWNVYRTQAKNRMFAANYSMFKQKYDQVLQHKNLKDMTSIRKASLSGVTDKSMKTLASRNPEFHKHLINMSATNPELAAQIQQFLPQPKFSTQLKADPSYYAALAGGTAIAGGAGASWLSQVDPKAQAKNFEAYKTAQTQAMTPVMKEARKARKALEAAKKSGKPARIKHAQYKYDQAYKKMRRTRAGTTMRPAKSRWGKFTGKPGLRGAAMRGGLFMAGPMILQEAVKYGTGNEKVGQIAGTSSRAALGAKFTLDSLRRVMAKHGTGKVSMFLLRRAPWLAAKIGLKAGIGAVTGGSGFGMPIAVAMAAWTVKDLTELMKLLSELD